MRLHRVFLLLSFGLFSFACDDGGAAGTGGTGGSTGGSTTTMGSGGTGAATTTAGSGGNMGGSGGGASCMWSPNDPCGPGFYCNAAACGMGTCEKAGGLEDDTRKPVCGCDGITYWNATIAASQGMAVLGPGQCDPGINAISCGGIAGGVCPAGKHCNYQVQSAVQCQLSDALGYCWGLPAVCGGGIGFGPNTRQCGAALCKEECELIKSDVTWYVDDTCPQ